MRASRPSARPLGNRKFRRAIHLPRTPSASPRRQELRTDVHRLVTPKHGVAAIGVLSPARSQGTRLNNGWDPASHADAANLQEYGT